MTWIDWFAVVFSAVMAVSGVADLAWRKLRSRKSFIEKDWNVRMALTLFIFGGLMTLIVAIQAVSHYGVLNLMVSTLPGFVAILAIVRRPLAAKLAALDERDLNATH